MANKKESNGRESELVALVISKSTPDGNYMELITPGRRYMIKDGEVMDIVSLGEKDYVEHFFKMVRGYAEKALLDSSDRSQRNQKFQIQVYRGNEEETILR